MAYTIEIGHDGVEAFYLEIAFIDANTGGLLTNYQVDHQLISYGASSDDYGFSRNDAAWAGCMLASNSNGKIISPTPGVIAINIPPASLPSQMRCRRGGLLRCKLVAVPADVDFTKKLADVIIYFGEGAMASPRVSLNVYPIYPNLPGYSASGVAPVQGVFNAIGRSESFTPLPERGFNVTIGGTFTGASVSLERSFDNGMTWAPTQYLLHQPATRVIAEPEADVLYSLNCTAIASGTINYRMSQ